MEIGSMAGVKKYAKGRGAFPTELLLNDAQP